MTENVAILWDIENVTPRSSDNLLIQGMWDYAESLGRVVTSFAYADWSKPGFRSLGPVLAGLHFTMLHVPYQRSRKNKNGSDMQLVTDALELLRFHDHITTFVLITGDSDFRSLLLSLRKSGKKIHIICDIKTAAQDLLILADSFTDYKELLPDNDEDSEEADDSDERENKPREYWFERLAETAAILQKDKKSSNMGSVKIKMKMLNRDFNEKKIGKRGYKRWSDFVTAAVRAGFVILDEVDGQPQIYPGKGYVQEVNSLQTALKTLIETLQELDEGKGSSKDGDFHTYSIVSSQLKEKGVVMKTLGFSQFKKFISSAEARGLVETKMEHLRSYVRLQK